MSTLGSFVTSLIGGWAEPRLRLRLGFRLRLGVVAGGRTDQQETRRSDRRVQEGARHCGEATCVGTRRATTARATARGGRSSASRAGGRCRSSSCRSRAGRPSARTSCPRGTGGARRLRASRGRRRARRRGSGASDEITCTDGSSTREPARRRRACSPTRVLAGRRMANET